MPRDPYRNFKFEVEIEGFVHAGFQKVSGIKSTTESIEYREGAENETPRKLTGQTMFDDVTLERGTSNNEDFLQWRNMIFNVDNVDGNQGTEEGFRKDVIIYLKNKSGTRVKKWKVLNAWPSEYSIGDLDASGNDVLIETMVLKNEGIQEELLA